MGKKHKKLKKKSASASSPSIRQEQPIQASAAASIPSASVATPAQTTQIETEEFNYVRSDVKKIFMLLALIIILLIGVYYLGTKTSVLTSTSDWVYKILNIQTQ